MAISASVIATSPYGLLPLALRPSILQTHLRHLVALSEISFRQSTHLFVCGGLFLTTLLICIFSVFVFLWEISHSIDYLSYLDRYCEGHGHYIPDTLSSRIPHHAHPYGPVVAQCICTGRMGIGYARGQSFSFRPSGDHNRNYNEHCKHNHPEKLFPKFMAHGFLQFHKMLKIETQANKLNPATKKLIIHNLLVTDHAKTKFKIQHKRFTKNRTTKVFLLENIQSNIRFSLSNKIP